MEDEVVQSALATRLAAVDAESFASAKDLAVSIYENPELSLKEHQAHEWTTQVLRNAGFEISTVRGLDTAFVATLDSGIPGPRVGLLAEYDALPDIGHGCGHHLIAGSAVSAALSAATVVEETGGSIQVFGCPAEETGIGKARMLDAGIFDSTTAALTYHAYDSSAIMVSSNGLRETVFDFTGVASHAAEDPWVAKSALDGVLLTFQNVNALRQFTMDGTRIHGIITDGGKAVNVIPEKGSCSLVVRAKDPSELERVFSRVRECAEAAAVATRTTVVAHPKPQVDPVLNNTVLADIVSRAFEEQGGILGEWPTLASTDFGNVSRHLPGVLFSVQTWPEGVTFHSREAAYCAGQPMAYEAMRQAGLVMAQSAVELLTDPALAQRAEDEFRRGELRSAA